MSFLSSLRDISCMPALSFACMHAVSQSNFHPCPYSCPLRPTPFESLPCRQYTYMHVCWHFPAAVCVWRFHFFFFSWLLVSLACASVSPPVSDMYRDSTEKWIKLGGRRVVFNHFGHCRKNNKFSGDVKHQFIILCLDSGFRFVVKNVVSWTGELRGRKADDRQCGHKFRTILSHARLISVFFSRENRLGSGR